MRVCSVCRRCYDASVAFCADETHPPLLDAREGAPTVIAGYRLESLLKEGDRNEVYRAIQTDSGHSCLISTISVDEEISEKFLREAKLDEALFHPSVVDT